VHYVKIITFLLSPKNVIDAVQSEGNLNQIAGSLRRKMAIIGNGHVGIWFWHARHARHFVRVVTWLHGPSGIWALQTAHRCHYADHPSAINQQAIDI